MSDDKQEWTRDELEALGVPRARAFRVFECDDPHCGAHFLAMDTHDKPICEMVVGQDTIPHVITWLELFMRRHH